MHRLNHAQLTVPRGTFTDEWFADLGSFYGDILGWTVTRMNLDDVVLEGLPEIPGGIPPLAYLYLDDTGQQYLVISEDDHPMVADSMEHLGLITEARDEVYELYERCRTFATKDSRCVVTDIIEGDAGAMSPPFENGWKAPYTVTGFNVSYLMPVSWDVSHDSYTGHPEPPKRWRYA